MTPPPVIVNEPEPVIAPEKVVVSDWLTVRAPPWIEIWPVEPPLRLVTVWVRPLRSSRPLSTWTSAVCGRCRMRTVPPCTVVVPVKP
jgi:hypothetical protein